MSKRKADQDKASSKAKTMDDHDDDGSDSDDSIINVDFEFIGLNSDIDFKGLKMLIKQLFDVDNELFDLSRTADLILAQGNHVGTAVKCDGEESDPYAFISVINVQQHKDDEAIRPIIQYLESQTVSNADIQEALSSSIPKIGLVLSERFINMPHQVVPALYNMLQREMSLGGDAFKFTHFLILSKTYLEVQSTLDNGDRPQKKQRSGQAETFYFHPEDEVLQRHAIASHSFDYQKEDDPGRSDSKRAFQEAGIKSQGHVVLLDATKFDKAVESIAMYFAAT